jgi:putative ABC transport system permease protein
MKLKDVAKMRAKSKILKPRWRKVLADLWEGKTRTLLVVVSIAVGVFAIGGIAASYKILLEDLNLGYAAIHPANIEMSTTPFDQDFLDTVEHIPGVRDAEGRRAFNVRVSQDGKAWRTLSLVAVDDLADLQINLIRHIAGASVPGEHELLIGYEQMFDTGFRTGDVLQVRLPDNTLRTMRVAGEIGDQTRSHDPMGAQRGYIDKDTLTWLGEPLTYNRLVARVSENGDDEDHIRSVADVVVNKIEKSGGTVYRSAVFKSTEFPMAIMALAVLGILGILGVLVMLLSSSLIVNTLNALFAQQLRQIGVMKLIGARGRQVLVMYLLLILAYSLIALMIAVPLGAWAGYALASWMVSMFNATPGEFRIVPGAILIQVVIAICVPLVAGILPVRSGSKISVRRALSSDRSGDQGAAPGRFDALNQMSGRLFSRPLLLSLRNTFRRKGRLMLTLFTLTTAGAIFIGVFNVRESMNVYMDHLMQHFMADITLNFDRPYRTARITQAALQVPGVQAVEAWSGAAAEILDENGELLDNLNLVAPPADTALLKAEMLAGRWIQPGDQRGLVVSDAIYDLYPNLQPGDALRLRVAGDRVEDWTVVGVFRFSSMLGDVLGYADYTYVSDLLGTPGQAASYRLITNAHTLEAQRAMGEAIDSHMRGLNYRVSNVEAGLVTRQQSGQGVNILIVFLLSMALLTAFVGSIGLTGTMGMNVLERTREIGVMRAIGAVDLAIIKSVVIEGVFIGLISWGMAWALSYPISFLLLNIISAAIRTDPIALAFTLEGVFVWLAVVLVLSAVASVLPARNAARLTIREVLAYE